MIFELILAALLTQSTQTQDFDSLKNEAVSEELPLSDEDKIALKKLKTDLFMTSMMQCSNAPIFNGVPFAFDAVVEMKAGGRIGAVTTQSSDNGTRCISRVMGKLRLRPDLKTPHYLYINVDSKITTVP